MDPQRKHVFYFSCASRIGFLLMSFLSDLVVPDLRSDGFKTAAYDPSTSLQGFWRLLSGLLRWDAHHFLHIAQFGYTYENNLAFFPLFPFIARVFGFLFNEVFHLTEDKLAALLLGALIFNNFIFVKASLALYDLTLYMYHDTNFAYMTAVFFCLSPATIFFIAPYTESFFSYCAFKGMLDFSRRKTYSSLFWFCLSVCLRSNGITFAGFMMHTWAYYCMGQFSRSNVKHSLNLILQFTLHTLQYVAVVCSPYILFQTYSYLIFCVDKKKELSSLIFEHANQYNLTMPSDHIDWCIRGFTFPYLTIQEKLWDVGFLKYYKFKQIPNFLLAFPIVFLIIYNGTKYLIKNIDMVIDPSRIYSYRVFMANVKTVTNEFPSTVFLYFGHIMFLTIWGLMHINVQVLTRLVASSSPVLYWIAAMKFSALPKSEVNSSKWTLLPFERGRELTTSAWFVKWYFLSYAVIGVILFSNNFPWT